MQYIHYTCIDCIFCTNTYICTYICTYIHSYVSIVYVYTYNRLTYTYSLLQEVELDQLGVLIYKLPLSPAKKCERNRERERVCVNLNTHN